jgi:uncharacterized protein (TIGR02466 family)
LRKLAEATALNQGLERAILARRQSGQGHRLSNVGGWQSVQDLLNWPAPEVTMLMGEVDRVVQQVSAMPAMIDPRYAAQGDKRVAYHAQAWANINEAGHYNTAHIHAGNHWSVVYYVTTGEPAPGYPLNGRLELRDPRPGAPFGHVAGFGFGSSMMILPEPGLIVLFPAWVEHSVHPFHGRGQRISIAFNITLDDPFV